VFVALVVVVVFVSLVYVTSGVAKLSRHPKVIDNLVVRLHVPPAMVVPLGLIDLAGAGGLLLGLRFAPLGIAAAIASVGYFAGALSYEVRGGSTARQSLPPLLLGFVCIVASGLRGATS